MHIMRANRRALYQKALELEAQGRTILACKTDCLWASGTAEPVSKCNTWQGVFAGAWSVEQDSLAPCKEPLG